MTMRCGAESFKIMEWNINHRVGYSKNNMPEWIIDVIKEDIAADIIILTECSRRVPNWGKIKETLFSDMKYVVFESNNDQGDQNDVLIAVNGKKFQVLYAKTFYSGNANTPDHLEVKVKCKNSGGREFTVVGMRIHALDVTDENDNKKREAFRLVLDSLASEKTVIIGGDFNNYRRSCTKRKWCMQAIDEICTPKGFHRYTPPTGSSIYEEHLQNDDNTFAEDHFIIKGIDEKDISLQPYDRSFTEKDKDIYIWGRNFSKYDWSTRQSESIPSPYPDHAILIADVTLE